MIIRINKLGWPYPEWAHATTIWPFIFVERDNETPCLIVHEYNHLRTQLKWGVLPWFLVYAILLPFYGGGRRHPLEKPAYAEQDECNDSHT